MPLNSSTATSRRVWILMFDHLQIDGADPIPLVESGDASPPPSLDHFNSFDDLDLRCSSFEQYVLQDSRVSARLTDVLGGQRAFERFAKHLDTLNKSSGLVRLSFDDSPLDYGESTTESATRPEHRIEWPSTIERRLPRGACDSSMQIDPELRSTLSADVVWIEVIASGDACREDSDRLLKLVQQWRLESQPGSETTPVLIVSAIHGYARKVNPPFASGLAESLIHVPLWIDHGASHACRIQTLAGSFDLLPTVGEFLLGSGNLSEPPETKPPNPSEQSGGLKGAPLSLAGVCSHSQPLPDRLLQLTGDSWTALRTQQYLLVHPVAGNSSRNEAGYSADDEMRATRCLYLKPDDVWNVNDAIVAYSSIADQMELTAAQFQHRDP